MKKVAVHRIVSFLLISVLMLGYATLGVYAESNNIGITAKVYEFEKDNHYDLSSGEFSSPNKTNTYGAFFIDANVVETSFKDGVSAYKIDDGKLSIMYTYTDALLNAGIDEWHLVEDKSKQLDIMKLDSEILKGTIVVQTSKDRKNWVNVKVENNVFADKPVNTEAIYQAQDIQLINGCFYRVIVVYELEIRIEESHILFVDTSKYNYKKMAEVYEFYAYSSETGNTIVDPQQTYNIGKVVRAEKFDGYAGEKEIVKGDPHYGITLGQFYVSGYTDTAKDDHDNMVFLKNVGDKVVLWFSLKENIDALGGNKDIKVTSDKKGSDQYFQTKTTDFGRGTLIVRYTDYNKNTGEPQIYTNYLEANASVDADTEVSLFEEGDYEVALDYELTEDKLFDTKAHYRIYFKFSIRNGNSMFYLFDLVSGAELTNSSMTENGFRLDLARSRYLNIIVKREVMADSADGLVEDTRFNGPAKDGAEYTTDGIYTITVSNQYTNQLTVKKIYVGRNPVLRAHMATGLSIPEINNLVASGATIKEDGTIKLASSSTPVTDTDPYEETEPTEPDDPKEPTDNPDTINIPLYAGIAGVVIVVIAAVAIATKKKKKAGHTGNEEGNR